jgi:outer membrane cobalamin receptor
MLGRFRPEEAMLHLLVSLVILSLAQSDLTINGVVRDASGAVIAGATVDAVIAARVVESVTTGPDGRYDVRVPAGVPVDLHVRRDGFADQIVSVPAAEISTTRDVTLRIGGVSDTLVVTASRAVESRASVTESLTAFTRAEIDTIGARSLADVMRYVSGVSVEAAGREGGLTSMFARGGESDYNLVLVDGVRANLSGGTFDFGRIDAAQIERVEIVRGAQSALWGSDAMGAVVNIVTRGANATDLVRTAGAIDGGSFASVRANARVDGRAAGIVDYGAGVSHRKTDGAFADLLPEDDRFEQTSFDIRGGAALGRRASLRANLRHSEGDGASVGAIAFGARDTGGRYNTNDTTAHIALSHLIGTRFSGTATFNAFDYESLSADTVGDPPFGTYAILTGTPNAIFPNGTRLVRLIDVNEFNTLAAAGALPAPGQFLASRQSSDFPFTSLTEFHRPAFRYQAGFPFGAHQMSAGYEWERESNPLTTGFRLSNHAAFVQQQFAIDDRWFAAVGGRVDSKDTYATFFSPKLSVGGYLVPFGSGRLSSLKVFANVGRGIKSPTFTERLGGSFADPSPGLRVERARTGDVGVEATLAAQRLLLGVTYFNNDYVDQIAFRSGVVGDGIPEYINIDGSRADGWEIEAALQRVAGFTARATYALVDSRVVTNLSTSQQFQPGQPLLRRPKHSGTIRATYVKSRASLSFDARIVGDRHDNSFLSLRTVPNAERPAAITTDITVNPGYVVMGVGGDLRLHRSLTVFVRGDNIGDEAYQGALGYPGLPRSFVAGARFDIGRR